jgi:hypothetical protein
LQPASRRRNTCSTSWAEQHCDAVASISWDGEEQWKGPNDAEWHKLGPGLSLGAFPRRQVPADAIETIDGLEIILSAPDPSIFVGKVIDYQDGKFQLRDP